MVPAEQAEEQTSHDQEGAAVEGDRADPVAVLGDRAGGLGDQQRGQPHDEPATEAAPDEADDGAGQPAAGDVADDPA